MNHRHPFFPRDTRLTKGIGDMVDNLNPVKQVKNVSKSIKEGNWADALHATTGAGSAVRPSAVMGTLKATFNPASQYTYRGVGEKAPTLLTPASTIPAPMKTPQQVARRSLFDSGNGAGTSLLKP